MPDSTQGNSKYISHINMYGWRCTVTVKLELDRNILDGSEHGSPIPKSSPALSCLQTHGQKRNTGKLVASSDTAMTYRSYINVRASSTCPPHGHHGHKLRERLRNMHQVGHYFFFPQKWVTHRSPHPLGKRKEEKKSLLVEEGHVKETRRSCWSVAHAFSTSIYKLW